MLLHPKHNNHRLEGKERAHSIAMYRDLISMMGKVEAHRKHQIRDYM